MENAAEVPVEMSSDAELSEGEGTSFQTPTSSKVPWKQMLNPKNVNGPSPLFFNASALIFVETGGGCPLRKLEAEKKMGAGQDGKPGEA